MKKIKILPVILLSLVLSGCQFFALPSDSSSNSPNSNSETGGSSENSMFTITWKNYDDEVLEIDYDVPKDTLPTYEGETPVKAGNQQFYNSFTGWTPNVVPATSDATYTATFEQKTNKYTVTWKNYDGTVLKVDGNVEYGVNPIYDGETPIKTGNAQYKYTFSGWSPEVIPVSEDVTYIAKFNELINAYRVTWKNYDGTVLEVDENVEYGANPSYDGETPIKEGNAEIKYSFSGWSPEVIPVSEDVTYIAKFNESINTYRVTWKNYDGTVLEVDEDVEYGANPSYDGETPIKVGNAEIKYSFSGWSPELTTVTSNIIYTATFSFVSREKYVLATDEDFSGEKDGFFVYVGEADYVIIPEYIKGVKLTTPGASKYNHMFMTRTDIKGVSFENPANIKSLNFLFYNNTSLTLELTFLDTSNVTSMSSMFYNSQASVLDMSSFDTSKVTSMYEMFYNSQATSLDLRSFNTSNVTYMASMFHNSQATFLDVSSFNTSKVTSMEDMFYNSQATSLDLRSFNTSKVTNMHEIFYRSQATSLDVSSFDTSNITDMRNMFYGSKATVLDLKSFNTSKVTDMYSMFSDTHAISIDLSSFDTSKVTNMMAMFMFTQAPSLDLRPLNTSKVLYMTSMFSYSKATTINVSSFDTRNVYSMYEMFFASKTEVLDLTSFNTKSLKIMSQMFADSETKTLDLSSFDTTNVIEMDSLFYRSKAILGYARNQTEANKFNKQKNIFIVK